MAYRIIKKVWEKFGIKKRNNMNLEQLKQVAQSLGVLEKVAKVAEAKTPTWSVNGELFHDKQDALVWVINCALPTELSACQRCRLKVKSCPNCAL